MPSPFTPDQLTSLSLEIKQQLAQLRDEPPPPAINHIGNKSVRLNITTSHADFQFRAKGTTRHQFNRGVRLQSLQRTEEKKQKVIKRDIPDRLPVQWQTISTITNEEPRSFWRRFKQAARRDLCEDGGVLHTQWKKHSDLSNEEVLKSFGAILAAMGFSGNVLQMLAVASGVIVIHIGCKAICAEE